MDLNRVVPSPINCEAMGRFFGCYTRIPVFWVVLLGGMSVTQFIGFGHIARFKAVQFNIITILG